MGKEKEMMGESEEEGVKVVYILPGGVMSSERMVEGKKIMEELVEVLGDGVAVLE